MPATIHNLINNAATTVVGSVTDSATSITVASALSVTAPFLATFADTGEIIRVGTASGTAWSNITRGYDGTIATSHASGTALELRVTAQHMTERRPYNVFPSTSSSMNTLNLRAALASEGYLSLAPASVFNCARIGMESQILDIGGATWINGNGAHLALADGTPNTVDLVAVRPATGWMVGGIMENLTLRPQTAGQGRYGLHVDTSQYGLGHHQFRNIRAGWWGTQFNGHAIKTTSNGGDRIWRTHFCDIQLLGHAAIALVGDSCFFERWFINADIERVENGRAMPAVDIQSMTQFSGNLTIKDWNAVAAGPVLRVAVGYGDTSYNSVTVTNIDYDYIATTNPPLHDASCYIDKGTEVAVRDCRFNAGNAPSGTTGLHLHNSQSGSIYNNQLWSNGTGHDLKLTGDPIDDPEAFWWGGHYVGHNRLARNRVLNLDPAPRAAL